MGSDFLEALYLSKWEGNLWLSESTNYLLFPIYINHGTASANFFYYFFDKIYASITPKNIKIDMHKQNQNPHIRN